jgi:pimeloyl-ACP methyl ester carboxylesterase
VRLAVAGGELEYWTADGDDPPLVFLHEGLGSVGLWRSWPAEVAERTGHAAVAWSRHGYGRSAAASRRGARYMHDEALEVLPEVLGAIGVGSCLLVGHSDGASIALIYTGGLSVATVRGVVAIAPHVFVEDRSVEAIAQARAAYLHGDLRDRLARHHADVDGAFWGWNDVWLSAEFRDWNIEEYLPGVACPVLVVQSADDEYGTLEQVERIEAGVSGPVTRLVLASGGHSPHLTCRAVVTEAVAGFVASLPQDTASAP